MTKLFIHYEKFKKLNNCHNSQASHLYNMCESFSKVFDEIEQVFSGIFFHFSVVTSFSSSRLFDDWKFIQTFNSCYWFSIGYKSGLIEGISRSVIFFFWNYVLTDLNVCLGSLSCWKVNHWCTSRFFLDSCWFSSRILI